MMHDVFRNGICKQYVFLIFVAYQTLPITGNTNSYKLMELIHENRGH